MVSEKSFALRTAAHIRKTNGVISFVDFGLVGQLNMSSRNKLASLFEAVLQEDFELVSNLWLQICNADKGVNRVAFQRSMEPIFRSQMNQPLQRTRLGEMMFSRIGG